MKLTEHFTLEEFTFSENATRLGIDNRPNVHELANLQRLAEVLEGVRALFGQPIRISSGFRSKALNSVTPGSSDTSAHTRGLAVDFTVKGFPVTDACRKIRDSGMVYDQLIHEGGWVHLGLSDGKPRREELRAVFMVGHRTQYLKGLP